MLLFYVAGNEENVMALSPSVSVIVDGHWAITHITGVGPTTQCLVKLVQRTGMRSTAEHKTKVLFSFA